MVVAMATRLPVRSTRVLLTIAALVPLIACAPGLGGEGGDDDTSMPDPSDDDPNDPNDPNDDPSVCLGDGGSGGACTVTDDCSAPLVCLDGVCVGPSDPNLRCDPVEGNFCQGEGEECVAGVCVVTPGTCSTTAECPVGYLCTDGVCEPDRDGEACADPGPGPELTGTWNMTSNLHLREGLPGLVDGLLDVSELFRDFIQGDADFGLPSFIQTVLNAVIADLINQNVPSWAQDLVLALAGVSDVLDTMQVQSTMLLDGQSCDATYRGSSTWNLISFEYDGQMITAAPDTIPEIGAVEPEDFGARYYCGDLYIDRHRIHNTLSGLVRWLINTVVEVATGYPTPESAIDAAIDCSAIAVALNNAYQSLTGLGGITGTVEAACTGLESQLLTELQQLIDDAAVQLSVVSLQGVGKVANDSRLDPGTWYGSVVGGDFPGDFTAVRQ